MNTWINAKTNEIEYFEGFPPQDRIKEFMPQIPTVGTLYDLYIMKGETHEDAFILVLEACIVD